MLVVELVALWFAIAVAIGLPLGSRIRHADAVEFPMRQETPWWLSATPTSEVAASTVRSPADDPGPSPFLELELELALGRSAEAPALR